MRCGRDAGCVQRLDLLDVFQDPRELPREQVDFVRRKIEPRELGDAEDILAREGSGHEEMILACVGEPRSAVKTGNLSGVAAADPEAFRVIVSVVPIPRRHISLLRSLTLADALTIGNASCGTLSILLCLDYLATHDQRLLWLAFGLLPLALVFDVLDGYVARLHRTRQSRLGADLDSLSDIISFGVAPTVLGFTLGLRGGWDLVCLTYFVVCGVSRLARFNVTAAELSDAETGKVKYFEGTPIPTSIVIVLLLATALWVGRIDEALWFGAFRVGPALFHPLVLIYLLSGSAMVSATLRIPKP